ncbi:SHOCT domain-containing protein [Corallococcus sp. BB11-1]|uniref:SHOCT domain-containing protein n=1 Tax=Corallococcus sp. BB11-1 TaxID=2996783 RepID=UPI0010CEDC31|nr:SHOCT domain-containing protein [Corallococcus sp. BB11-1]MCY1033445.1 SHOCT domain-containing protein [Corallococcus sp. BB11-1]RYZ33348.1 MAG: SHOCT domain-containing protein [Myxococcaceae bacterium]
MFDAPLTTFDYVFFLAPLVGVVLFLVLRSKSVQELLKGIHLEDPLLQNGEAAEATVLEVRDTALRINKQPVLSLLLEVRPSGRAPYQVKVQKRLTRFSSTATWQPGLRVDVKFDPKHPLRVALVGPVTTPLASPPPAAKDPIQAMTDLKRMADAGLITAREYEDKKAELLARL